MACGENERKAVKSAILCQKSPILEVLRRYACVTLFDASQCGDFSICRPQLLAQAPHVCGKLICFGLEENKHDAAAQRQKHRCERQQRVCFRFARRATLHFKVQMTRLGTFCRVLRMRALFLALDASFPHKKSPQAASQLELGCAQRTRCAARLRPLRRALGSLIFFFQAADVDAKSFKSASRLAMFFSNF